MGNIPTDQDLQKPRTPSELRLFVKRALNDISCDKDAREKARLWNGQAKALMREILPMSYFALWKWPKDDIRIQPQLGSQGYDAKILTRDGKPPNALEVSWAVDGEVHKESMRALNQTGASIETWDKEKLHAAAEETIRAAKIKAEKDYQGYILLIGLHPPSCTKHVRVVGGNPSPGKREKGTCHETPKEFCC